MTEKQKPTDSVAHAARPDAETLRPDAETLRPPRFRGWPLRTIVAGMLCAVTLLALSGSSTGVPRILCVAHLRFDPAADGGSWEAELRWPPDRMPLEPGVLEVSFGGAARTPVLWLFRERSAMLRVRGEPPADAPPPDVDALLAAAIDREERRNDSRPLATRQAEQGDDSLIRSFYFTRVRDRLGLSLLERIDAPHAALTLLAGALALLTAYSAYRWRRGLRRAAIARRDAARVS